MKDHEERVIEIRDKEGRIYYSLFETKIKTSEYKWKKGEKPREKSNN